MWIQYTNLSFFQQEGERGRSLILYGPSRLGKTEWARSLGPHFYLNGGFDLGELDETKAYAIFDDFDWTTFKSYKQWLGCQRLFTVTDKYRKKMQFHWGKPCILLSNQRPEGWDEEWLAVNCEIIRINNKLF